MSSTPARQRATTPRGFTLIELLVVIAIIAILAAILFPVFARVREKANQTSCLSNQRQLAVALMIYANDHDEMLPLPNEWVEASNLAADPKIFNCPSTSAQGVPSAPNYGMNAFLFNVDPQSGGLGPVSLGQITDPTTIELTADIANITANTIITLDPNDPNYYKQAIKQEFSNPFPTSYSIMGFGGGGNGAARHGGKVAASYVDGHVALLGSLDLGSGMTGYNIPRSGGRMYVRFADTKDWTDAQERLHAAIGFNIPGPYDTIINSAGNIQGVTYNTGNPIDDSGFSPAGGWKMTGPANLAFNAGDTYCYIASGGNKTLMLDVSLSSDAVVLFGALNPYVESLGPFMPSSDSPTYDWNSVGKAIQLNNAIGFIRGGSELAYAGQNYIDYTSPDWIAPPTYARGKSFLFTSARNVRLELVTSAATGSLYFPTEPDAYWQFSGPTADKHTFYATTAVTCYTKFKVITAADTVQYEGPWIAYSYSVGSRPYPMLTVAQGSMTLKEILYTGQ